MIDVNELSGFIAGCTNAGYLLSLRGAIDDRLRILRETGPWNLPEPATGPPPDNETLKRFGLKPREASPSEKVRVT